jgi:oligopeptide/dipeptide ABC transporter ATP-binding protein
MTDTILEVKNFSLDLRTEAGDLPVLSDINFYIKRGEFLSLVGESGCGKSVCALSITKLLPKKLAVYKSGEVLFNGINLLEEPSSSIQKIRGNDISYIFQEPFSSLNPLHRIQDQMIEGYIAHNKGSKLQAIEKARYLLGRVGITDIDERLKSYPNQMSGGMLQRISIAMALMCDPILLVADEPTSAIDVTIQSQLIELLFELKKEMNLSVLFISHDIALVSYLSDRINVMYAGCMVESGSVEQVIDQSKHPYTQALLKAYPSIKDDNQDLEPIPGMVPSPSDYPIGCHFTERCTKAMDQCKLSKPKLQVTDASHEVSCFLYGGQNAGN